MFKTFQKIFLPTDSEDLSLQKLIQLKVEDLGCTTTLPEQREPKFLLGNDRSADIQKSHPTSCCRKQQEIFDLKKTSPTHHNEVEENFLMPYIFVSETLRIPAACSCKPPLGWSAKPWKTSNATIKLQLFVSWAKSYPNNFRVTRQGPGINQCSFCECFAAFGFCHGTGMGLFVLGSCMSTRSCHFLNSWRGSFEDVFSLRGSYRINPNAESLFCNVGCTVTA